MSSVSGALGHKACVPSEATWCLEGKMYVGGSWWRRDLTWWKVSPMTGLGGVLFVLTGGRASQKSLLFDLDHLEGVAVAPLSRVLTL